MRICKCKYISSRSLNREKNVEIQYYINLVPYQLILFWNSSYSSPGYICGYSRQNILTSNTKSIHENEFLTHHVKDCDREMVLIYAVVVNSYNTDLFYKTPLMKCKMFYLVCTQRVETVSKSLLWQRRTHEFHFYDINQLCYHLKSLIIIILNAFNR